MAGRKSGEKFFGFGEGFPGSVLAEGFGYGVVARGGDEVAVGKGVMDIGGSFGGGNADAVVGDAGDLGVGDLELREWQQGGQGLLDVSGIVDFEDGYPGGLRGGQAIQFYGEFAGEMAEEIVLEADLEKFFHWSYGGERARVGGAVKLLGVVKDFRRVREDDAGGDNGFR